jgi:predicted TIM-barrel fold metal-dependent hydrolase
MSGRADRRVHDADSHVMESSDWLTRHTSRGDDLPLLSLNGQARFADEAIAANRVMQADPVQRRAAEDEVLQRRAWWALGATFPDDRSRALNLLGYSRQLVFSTHSGRALIPETESGAPASAGLYGAVRAHNRAIASFCRADPRLLPVAWIRLDDPEEAVRAAAESLLLGCAAVEVPSALVGPYSLVHPRLDALWDLLEETATPLVFHLGGGRETPSAAWLDPRRGDRSDAHGNLNRLRRLRAISLAAPVELMLAALIFEGTLERHPRLKVGVIEYGASWLPGLFRRLDLAVRLDHRMSSRDRLAVDLPLEPGDYLRRQVKVTPFVDESLDWLIAQTDARLYLFASDYPHVEGGTDPVREFEDRLAGQPEEVKERFFHRNFDELLGLGHV